MNRELYISAIMGNDPSLEEMNNKLISKCGYFTGGFVEEWTWRKKEIQKLTDDEILLLYAIVK